MNDGLDADMPRNRIKFPPRTRVYLRPGTSTQRTQHTPFDPAAFGPPITSAELTARLVHRKAF